MIFYSNSNIHQNFALTEKEKQNCCREWPRNLARKPARLRSARAGAARALASTQASLTAGPRCQLRLQAPAGRIDGAAEPLAPPSPLATRWSRSPLQGAPPDPLSPYSLLVELLWPRARRAANSAEQTPATTIK